MIRRQGLTDLAWRVLRAIKAGNGDLTAQALLDSLKVDPYAVVGAIVALQSRGFIRPVKYGLRVTRDGARALSGRFAQ